MGERTSDAAAIALLEAMVRIPSLSGQERPLAEYLVDAMARLGLESEIDAAGNAVGRLGFDGPDDARPYLLLLGHMDTVRGDVPVGRVHEDGDDRLYGRGSVDAKGPLAAFIMAVARVAERSGPSLGIAVVGAVEEEAATSKGAYHVVESYPPASAVIIGEPSGWARITLGYKGRLLLDYSLEREMSHTAGEARGAAEEAVDYWRRVRGYAEALNADTSGAFASLDPSLRAIHCDNDGLVERAELSIGLRLPLSVDVDALRRLALEEWPGPATVAARGYEQPYRADKRTPLTSAFLSAIRAEGQRAAFVLKTGTSDMNVIGPRWKVPIVAYGPGDSSLDHTPHEHIDLGEYLAAVRVLERVIERMALTAP